MCAIGSLDDVKLSLCIVNIEDLVFSNWLRYSIINTRNARGIQLSHDRKGILLKS
jgi:hypothetical protein